MVLHSNFLRWFSQGTSGSTSDRLDPTKHDSHDSHFKDQCFLETQLRSSHQHITRSLSTSVRCVVEFCGGLDYRCTDDLTHSASRATSTLPHFTTCVHQSDQPYSPQHGHFTPSHATGEAYFASCRGRIGALYLSTTGGESSSSSTHNTSLAFYSASLFIPLHRSPSRSVRLFSLSHLEINTAE